MTLFKSTLASAAVAALCLGGSMPARAQWGGGASMAAPTYCGARAQGLSHRQASDKAMWVLVNSADITTALGSGRAMKAGLEYQIRAMCPEFLESSVKRLEATPVMTEGCYYGELCKTLGL